ncbi:MULTISPECIES: hypothetical protein [unclassified Nostoc]|nr:MULTISPECIES: hypothetical protein [unclassified Nostoc]
MNQLPQHLHGEAIAKKRKISLSDRNSSRTSRYHRILWNFRA